MTGSSQNAEALMSIPLGFGAGSASSTLVKSCDLVDLLVANFKVRINAVQVKALNPSTVSLLYSVVDVCYLVI